MIALLGRPYLKNYKGIYRKFPNPPKQDNHLNMWSECLEFTEATFVEYNSAVFDKLYSLLQALHKEKIFSELVLISEHTKRLCEINNSIAFF